MTRWEHSVKQTLKFLAYSILRDFTYGPISTQSLRQLHDPEA